jgi:hypothetical protein
MHDRQYAAMTATPLPIPYTAVSQYAQDIGLPAGDLPTFHTMVRALDDEWRAIVAARAASKA